jgi:hypothetical protein
VRLANWRQARDAYQKSLNTWLDIESQRKLTFFEADKLGRIKSELASCEAALAQLTPPPH